jgi:hypothetical protein
MLLSTREFPAPKSTQRLGGIIWCGFTSGTAANRKIPMLQGTRYTERGENKAMHGNMMVYGLHGDQQGTSHLPPATLSLLTSSSTSLTTVFALNSPPITHRNAHFTTRV